MSVERMAPATRDRYDRWLSGVDLAAEAREARIASVRQRGGAVVVVP